MKKFKENTICSISTKKGESAISVIRISGSKSKDICKKIFINKQIKKISDFKPNKIYLGKIVDNNKILDEVILSYFQNPKSYTGEDVIEISCHGSEYIQNSIIQLLIKKGCSLAKRGEFTLRAFLNGKLDLSQAESVANLISSKNEKSHDFAMKQMRGGYSKEIQSLRSQLIKFGALIELELDFSTEDVEFANRQQLIELLNKIKIKLKKLIASFEFGNAIKKGIPIAIIGPPNSGKSTLLNKILNEEKAIVSEIKGTTRDTIEETFVIEGFEFRFIDTAGIRNTRNKIEKIGIQKTHKKIKEAAIVLYLFDVCEFEKEKFEKNIKSLIEKKTNVIFIANKIDLLKEIKINTEQELIYTSLIKNKGVNKILASIIEKTKKWELINQNFVITNQRHFESMTKTLKSVESVFFGIESNISGELLSIDIKEALNHLGEITGEITNEQLLDSIFRDFCIGK